MNKWLLIWNLVLTVLVISLVFVGCSSMDPQFGYLQSQVDRNTAIIEQLAEGVNQNASDIQNQALQNKALELSLSTRIDQVTSSLQSYVQDYVSSKLGQ